MRIALLSIAALFLAAGTASAKSFRVEQCPEVVRVSDCRVDKKHDTPSCVFENATDVELRKFFHLRGWAYDKQGLSLGSGVVIDLSHLQPGQKRLSWLGYAKSSDVRRIVVCSVDPDHPSVRGRLVFVQDVKAKFSLF